MSLQTSIVHDLVSDDYEMFRSRAGEAPVAATTYTAHTVDNAVRVGLDFIAAKLLSYTGPKHYKHERANSVFVSGEPTIIDKYMILIQLRYTNSPARVLTLSLDPDKVKLHFN